MRFILELADKASGPAKQALKSIKGLEAGIKGIDLAKVGASIGKGVDSIRKGVDGLQKFGAAVKPVVDTMVGVEAAFVAAGVAAATWAFKQISDSEGADFALKAIVEDVDTYNRAVKGANTLADLWGDQGDEIEKQITRLLQKGQDLDSAFRIVQGAHDLKVFGADVNQVIDAFTQLDDKGKLTSKGLAALAGAGLDPKKLRAILGTAIGSTGDIGADIEKAIASGTIKTADLQNAALQTITAMSGKELGALAQEQGKTLGGLVDNLKNLPGRLIDNLDTSGALEPVKKGLQSVIDTVSGPAGQAAFRAFGSILTTIAEKFAELATPENITAFIDGLATVSKVAFEVAKIFTGELASGFKAVFGPLMTCIRLSDGNGEAWSRLAVGLGYVAKAVGWALGFIALGFAAIGFVVAGAAWVIGEFVGWISGHWASIAKVVGAIAAVIMLPFTPLIAVAGFVVEVFVWLWDSLVSVFKGIGEFFTKTVPGWWQAGKDLVAGFILGMQDSASEVSGVTKSIAKDAEAAMKTALKIQSPSKVFADIGKNVTLGLALGIDATAARVSPYAGLMPANDVGAVQPGAAAGARGSFTMGDVVVSMPPGSHTGDPERDGAAIGAAVAREIVRAVEASARAA